MEFGAVKIIGARSFVRSLSRTCEAKGMHPGIQRHFLQSRRGEATKYRRFVIGGVEVYDPAGCCWWHVSGTRQGFSHRCHGTSLSTRTRLLPAPKQINSGQARHWRHAQDEAWGSSAAALSASGAASMTADPSSSLRFFFGGASSSNSPSSSSSSASSLSFPPYGTSQLTK